MRNKPAAADDNSLVNLFRPVLTALASSRPVAFACLATALPLAARAAQDPVMENVLADALPFVAGALAGLLAGVGGILAMRSRGGSTPAETVTADGAGPHLQPPWRDFFELSSDWLWQTDAALTFVDIPGAPPSPSIAPPGIIGRNWEDVVIPQLSPDFATAHRTTLERRGPITVALTLTSPTGERRHLELRGRPLFDSTGCFRGYCGIGRETSERARLESALERAEERFHAVLTHSADGYWEQDTNLRYTAVTARSGRLADLAAEHLLGSRRWDLPGVSQTDAPWADHIEQIRQIASFSNFVFSRRNAAGDDIWLSESGVPVFDERGLFAGYCGVTRDITAERARLLALQSRETHYRAVFDDAPSALAVIDTDGTWKSANAALGRTLGVAAETLVGRPLADFQPEDDARDGQTLRARILAGEPPPAGRETRFCHADGTERRCRETLAWQPATEDRPDAFVAVIEDITDRHATLVALQAAESRFRQLFDQAPEAMLVVQDNRIRLANLACRRLVCPPGMDGLDGLDPLELIHPDDRTMEAERLRHFLDDPTLEALPPLPVRYQRLDGRPLKIEASGIRLRLDGRDALLFVLRDVARWLSAEQVLRESRAMYRDVVESVNEILFQTNAAHRLTFLNRAWRHITGFDTRLSIGQSLLDFVVEDDRQRVEHELMSIRGGYADSARFEFRLRTQKSGPCWVEATVRPLRDSLDQSIGTSGTLDDITDRKNAEQSQRDLNVELETRVRVRTSQLEASNRELEAFSYSVSHDLRAPLRAIDGFAQIVAEDYGPYLDETGREYLQRIRAASQRMACLIDDLIDLARLTRQTMKREHVNLSQIAEQIVTELRLEDPDRIVDVHIEPNLYAAADRGLIRVALDNLLRNAWKFTGRRHDAQIRFHAEKRDRHLVYCISDNGAGFDMNFASKLFLPFHRMHGINEFAGTGIGLATVQRVILRHEGTIWAESTPEKGASFYFTLSH